MYNKYGLYESIDYTSTRLKKGEEYANDKNLYGTSSRTYSFICK